MDSESPSVDYAALTVAQLKALCKERKITGYSKLTKVILIQKLQGASAPPPPAARSTGPRDDNPAEKLAFNKAPSCAPSADPAITKASSRAEAKRPSLRLTNTDVTSTSPEPSSNSSDRLNVAPPLPEPPISASSIKSQRIHPGNAVPRPSAPLPTIKKRPEASNSSLPPDVESRLPPPPTAFTSQRIQPETSIPPPFAPPAPTPIVSRKRPADSITPTSSKKPRTLPRIEHGPVASEGRIDATGASLAARPSTLSSSKFATSQTHAASTRLPSSINARPPTTTVHPSSASPLVTIASASTVPLLDKTNATPLPAQKRFKPLVPVAARSRKARDPIAQMPPERSTTGSNVHASETDTLDLLCLALPSADQTVELSPITLPPSFAQRNSAHAWSIILSGLSDGERKQCVLVSRMFRYATYLSASAILHRDYAGRRLAHVVAQHPQSRTNMFPYLRQRAGEARARRGTFAASFLGRNVYGAAEPVAARLWASPDHAAQAAVAVRFLITRLWFWLSVPEPGAGYGAARAARPWLEEKIVDAQEVVADEVWSVAVWNAREGTTQTFYVLEATCEVVGHADASLAWQGPQVRADWSTYMQSGGSAPLLDRLQWAHRAEYDKGVSALWLKRAAGEGAVGRAKMTVARRYILASVIANSVSGGWMSSTEMAQEAASLPAMGLRIGRVRPTEINLFLPAQHHVESVHLHTRRNVALHPAVAVVQTPGREYFVLRENGMQIGCEEDGIAEVWQRVLGCDGAGVSII